LTRFYTWGSPFWVSQDGHLIGWWLMVGALAALSLSYRGARWAVCCGMLLSLIQTWTGITFLQGGGPVGTIVATQEFNTHWHSITVALWEEPGTSQWVEAAACLGVLFGAMAVVFGRRLPLPVRVFTGLGACVLVVGTHTSLGIPGAQYISMWDHSVWVTLHFQFFSFSWYFSPNNGWPGIANSAVECMAALAWGAQALALGCLAGLARWLVSITTPRLRTSSARYLASVKGGR